MTTIERKDFSEIQPLFNLIKSRHELADHTIKTLKENSHIQDFCEEAKMYAALENFKGKPLHISYEVSSWFLFPDSASIRIESITIYDDIVEYESARAKDLYGNGDASIPNMN